MNTSPFLSICIPTYNRVQYLRECLDSVLASANGIEQVEVIIVDNASTDDTPSLAARLEQSHPRIRYHRHPVNIGPENNFYASVELARGEYVWLLGDDDKLLPHAIPSALHCLKQGYDLLISNFSVWTNDFSAVKLKSMMRLRRDMVFTDPNQLLANLGTQLGYISAVVIKRQLFLRPPRADYDAFAEYGMAFLYIVYTSVATHCYGLYLNTPLVCNRDNPRGWTEETWNKFFIMGTRQVFAHLRQVGYSSDAVRTAKDRLLRDFALRTILGRARDGQNAWSLVALMRPDFKTHWFFWAACIPAALVPPALLRWATRIVRWRRVRTVSVERS
jgi:glycosyltransferase involved in cell wall biosynthesis